jgi:N-acetylglucosaminyldiphosphoundecaprenol N-acetyl-beta-D-mannosaminyltransferase
MIGEIFGHRLHSFPQRELIAEIEKLVDYEKRGFITFCNVHMIMEANSSADFSDALKHSIYNLTDGMPLVNHLLKSNPTATRNAGPDTMPRICELAEKKNWPIALFGDTPETIAKLSTELHALFPNLKINASISPPFRAFTAEEEQSFITAINESKSKFLFVSLGCPKQEQWMFKNQSQLNTLQFGVGAAFPILAGITRRAPLWMQKSSLEWLFRLFQEPRRLWRRYLIYNLKFLWLLRISKHG